MSMPCFTFRKRLVAEWLAEPIPASSQELAHTHLRVAADPWTLESMREEIIDTADDQVMSGHTRQRAAPDETPAGIWQAFRAVLTQDAAEASGGMYTTPGNRLTLLGLALSCEAQDILELGYDSGTTTMILALSGARVTGVDDHREAPLAAAIAEARLAPFPNVRLATAEAIQFLRETSDEAYDMVFVDDLHEAAHVRQEAHEVMRVLRPGGLACFHDTIVHGLWDVVDAVLPASWQRLEVPSRQHAAPFAGADFGLGVWRKPQDVPRPRMHEWRARSAGRL
jgi:predicted O-methyltransferase YrrM